MRTVREECLDWTLVLGRHHLEAVLRDYVRHYNQRRPHRGLRLQVPAPASEVTSASPSLSDIGSPRRARWARPRVPRRCLIRRDCGRVAHFLTTLVVLVSFVSIGASVDHAAIAAASCARLQDRRTRVTEPNACPCGSERHDRGSGALHLGGFVGQRDGPALHESERNRSHNSVLGMLPNQHKRRSTACAVPAGSASVRRRLAWSSDVQAHIRRHIRRQPCARPVRRQLQGAPPGGTRALWHRPLRRRRPPARWRSCRV